MRLAVIGLGLMGSSAAIDLKHRGFVDQVLGCDKNPLHGETAVRLGIVSESCRLEKIIPVSDLILLAVPVDAAIELLPRILDRVDRQIVTDFCSTKAILAQTVRNHPRRGRYVGAHPMAGTEQSGPWAAREHLFDGKAAIICDEEQCDRDALKVVEAMYEALSMHTPRIGSSEHDRLTAYISHLPHALAYALALTVLQKHKQTPEILELAGGGFDSVARLAKSSSGMWAPIFLSNREYVGTAITDFIRFLQHLEKAIADHDDDRLRRLLDTANRISEH